MPNDRRRAPPITARVWSRLGWEMATNRRTVPNERQIDAKPIPRSANVNSPMPLLDQSSVLRLSSGVFPKGKSVLGIITRKQRGLVQTRDLGSMSRSTWKSRAKSRLCCKAEVHVPHENSSPSGKRPYHSPTCTRRSIPEMAAWLRKEVSGGEKTSEAEGPTVPSQGPILVVEGYQGHIAEIGQILGAGTPRLQQKPAANGEELVLMRLNVRQLALPLGTFLLLDLRRRPNGGDRLLDSIARKLDANYITPLVILVTSLEQFCQSGSTNRKHCWKYRGRPSSTDLTTTLRSLRLLWAELAKFPKEQPAIEKAPFIDYYHSHRN